MSNKINAAIQVLPLIANPRAYAIVDEAIAIITNSGLHYEVCAFETTIDGTYEEIVVLLDKIRKHCLTTEAEEILINVKFSFKKSGDISMHDKIDKHRK